MGALGIFTVHHILPFSVTSGSQELWAMLGVSGFWCVLSAVPSWFRKMPVERQACIEALVVGMGAAVVCSPFWLAEPFMFAEINWPSASGKMLPNTHRILASVAVAVTLTSACYVAAKWAPLRAAWFAVLSATLMLFTWYIPSLSVLAVVAAVCLANGRRSLALLCAVMLVWWIGAFYYSLQSPLIDKAILLAASGIVLALTTVFLIPAVPRAKDVVPTPHVSTRFAFVRPKSRQAIAVLECAVLTLGIVNVSILQKEALAKAGTTIFVELMPVDPRSLIQGDYMQLAFGIGGLPQMSVSAQAALVGTVDEDNVWTARRDDDGTPLKGDEIKINLSGTPSHPIFVTDAWFFKEGEANRWQGARYGEFRVDADGNAVLITLRGINLERL